MILKIERKEFKAGDKKEFDSYWATMDRGCWIIGEIEGIHYKYIPKNKVAGYIDNPGHYNFCDLAIEHLTREKRISSRALSMAITFSDPSKRQFNIWLQDCTCYICNEDGKTVDKLIC